MAKNYKFYSVGEANSDIRGADEQLNPALLKAGITHLTVNGEKLELDSDKIPLSAKVSALLAVAQPGAGSKQVSDVLVSQDEVAQELKAEKIGRLSAEGSVAKLLTEKATLEASLNTAQASVSTLTAEKADLNNRLTAAMNQYQGETVKIKNLNTELSSMCLAVGCLELKGADGKPLAATATAEEKQAAAEAIPTAAKMEAYKGAVNSAMTKLGINVGTLPGQPAGGLAAKKDFSHLTGLDRSIAEHKARAGK